MSDYVEKRLEKLSLRTFQKRKYTYHAPESKRETVEKNIKLLQDKMPGMDAATRARAERTIENLKGQL